MTRGFAPVIRAVVAVTPIAAVDRGLSLAERASPAMIAIATRFNRVLVVHMVVSQIPGHAPKAKEYLTACVSSVDA